MTTPPNDATAGPRADAPAPPVARGVRPWIVASAVLALAVAGVIAWQDARQQSDALRLEVAQRLAKAEAALVQSRAKDADLGNDLRDAQAKIALLEARISESQSQQAALDTLYRDLAPSRDELALNEVEQILVLASQQLALAGNVQAALGAVELADAKLSRIERPQWAPMRRSLARDIDALKAVPYVDVAGIAAKLDQAQAGIDALQLARDERLPAPPPDAAAPPDTGWRAFLRSAWADVRSLVRIEVSDRPPAALIAPSQAYFLRENLRLRLLAARVSLLARDETTFREDLKAAQAWITRYYDPKARTTVAAVATLKQVADTPVNIAPPDINASLAAVRTARAAREKR